MTCTLNSSHCYAQHCFDLFLFPKIGFTCHKKTDENCMTVHVYNSDCKLSKVYLCVQVLSFLYNIIDTDSCPLCGPYEHCENYTGYECVCDDGFTGNPGNCNGTCNWDRCYATVMMTALLGMLNKFVILFVIISGQLWCHCMYRVRYAFGLPTFIIHIHFIHLIVNIALSNPIADIDECEIHALCQYPTGSICYNTIGSYECICPPGYTLSDDSNECILSSKLYNYVLTYL